MAWGSFFELFLKCLKCFSGRCTHFSCSTQTSAVILLTEPGCMCFPDLRRPDTERVVFKSSDFLSVKQTVNSCEDVCLLTDYCSGSTWPHPDLVFGEGGFLKEYSGLMYSVCDMLSTARENLFYSLLTPEVFSVVIDSVNIEYNDRIFPWTVQ